MTESTILKPRAMTVPGDWGLFKAKLTEEIDRPTAMKLAMYFQFPPADVSQLNDQDRPGTLCVRMLDYKGIITETNIDHLLRALQQMTLHGCEERVRSHFSASSTVYINERSHERDRDEFRYIDDDTIKSVADRSRIIVVNDVNRELFQNRIINFGLPDNINLEPSAQGGELRIAVVGKTGQGKSATANTVLGLKLSKEDATATSVTHATSRYRGIFRGRQILVVDTPGLQDSRRDKEFVLQEIAKVPQFLSDGVHAFIFVFNASCPRFTSDDKRALEELKRTFGRDVISYSLAVFTRAEAVLNSMSLTDFLQKQMEDPIFGSFLESLGSKVTAVNNGSTVPAEKQRNQEVIISLIDNMVQQRRNHGEKEVYTNEMFDVAKTEKEEIKKRVIRKGLDPSVYSAVEDAYSFSDDGMSFVDNVRRRLPQTYYEEFAHAAEDEGIAKTARLLKELGDEMYTQRLEHSHIRSMLLQFMREKVLTLTSGCTLV